MSKLKNALKQSWKAAMRPIEESLSGTKDILKGDFKEAFEGLKDIPGDANRFTSESLTPVFGENWITSNPMEAFGALYGSIVAAPYVAGALGGGSAGTAGAGAGTTGGTTGALSTAGGTTGGTAGGTAGGSSGFMGMSGPEWAKFGIKQGVKQQQAQSQAKSQAAEQQRQAQEEARRKQLEEMKLKSKSIKPIASPATSTPPTGQLQGVLGSQMLHNKITGK